MPTPTQAPLPQRLIIRPWPKMIFLWPTLLMCLMMGLANMTDTNWENVWGGMFLVVLGLNLMVITFDFPRGTSLTLAITGVAAVLLLFLLNQSFGIIQPIQHWFATRQIHASNHFYFAFFFVLVVLFIGMFIVTRFDYWELTANEIIHHHGVLGDVERFTTAGLKLNKEISDIFEYILAGSGRLILLIANQARPVVLDNILNIAKVEQVADRILDARVVRIDTGGGPPDHAHTDAARITEDS